MQDPHPVRARWTIYPAAYGAHAEDRYPARPVFRPGRRAFLRASSAAPFSFKLRSGRSLGQAAGVVGGREAASVHGAVQRACALARTAAQRKIAVEPVGETPGVDEDNA